MLHQAEATLRLRFARLRRRTPAGAGSVARHRTVDQRRKVTDPKALRTFVDETVSGDIGTLPTSSQRGLALKIRGWLGAKRTVNSVINAIVVLTKKGDDWWGVSAHTLKDNYYRPPGGPRGHAPRTKRYYKTALCS